MAEHAIKIDGITPSSGMMPVTGTVTSTPSGVQTVSGTVSTMPTVPTGTNFYTISFSAVAGQTAATYNFLSLFNPVGSGKTINVYASFIIPWATAATSTTNSMETFRTTAASGGTLTSGANINKFASAAPNSVAEVRTANPTITTTGATYGGIPPAITASGSGLGPSSNISTPSGSSFILMAGEGICMRQVIAGDVDQLWNLGYIWTES
jgi:hypothetical protein